MDFGLGLVLSFTDNASAGINNAVNSLGNLTTVAENATNSMSGLGDTALLASTAMAANMIGDSFTNMGSKMVGLFGGLVSRVQAVGHEYEDFNVTLKALYGSAGEAEKALNKLMDFSVKSPLEVGDVKDFLITLKSQGIDPFKEIQGSVSGARQETLAWITDLRSFKPDVALTRFKAMITNYVGSGEDKMIRTVLDMGDLEQVIGRKKADTPEGRLQDLIDFADIKGLAGLGNELSKTWTGVASNVGDAFTKLFKTIADNGVFQNLKDSFMSLATVITQMPDDEIKEFGKVVADAMNMIVAPMSALVKKVSAGMKSLIRLAQTHPFLVKLGIVLTTVSGGLLLLGGIAMKIIGSFAGLILVMRGAGTTLSGIASFMVGGIFSILGVIAKLAIGIAFLKAAWDSNLGGIQDIVSTVTGNIRYAWDNVSYLLDSDTSMYKFAEKWNILYASCDPVDTFTVALSRLIGFIKYTAEAWNDNTLSEDSWQRANQMGILPMIETMLDFKYRMRELKDGFLDAWNEMASGAKKVIKSLVGDIDFSTIMDNMLNNIVYFFDQFNVNVQDSNTAIGRFVTFLRSFSTYDKDISNVGFLWHNIGENLAPLSAVIASIVIGFKALGGVSKFIRNLVTFILPLGSTIGGVSLSLKNLIPMFGKLAISALAALPMIIKGFASVAPSILGGFMRLNGMISKVVIGSIRGILPLFYGIFSSALPFILTALKGIGLTVGTHVTTAIVTYGGKVPGLFVRALSGLGSVGALIIPKIISGFSGLSTMLGPVFSGAGKILVGLFTASIGGIPVAAIAAIGLGIAALIAVITGSNEDVNNEFSKIWDKIPEPVRDAINKSIDILSGAFDNLVEYLGIGPQVEQIKSFIEEVLPVVQRVGNGVISGIQKVIGWIQTIFNTMLRPIFTTVITEIKNAWDGWLGELIGNIIDFGKLVIGAIGVVIDFIVTNVLPVVTPIIQKIIQSMFKVWGVIGSAINGIVKIVKGIISFVKTYILPPIRTVITGIIDIVLKLKNRIDKHIAAIRKIFGGIVDFIAGVFTGNWRRAFKGLKDIVSGFADGIRNILEGIKEFIGPIVDWIGEKVGWVVDKVAGAWDAIQGFFGGDTDDGGSEKQVTDSGGATTTVPAMAAGGVVSMPTLSLIGEQGKEAVVPLENNTGWMDTLSTQIADNLNNVGNQVNMKPVIGYLYAACGLIQSVSMGVDSIVSLLGKQVSELTKYDPKSTTSDVSDSNTNYYRAITKDYITTTNNNDNKHITYDMRVTFSPGAINLEPKNASVEECQRMAQYIMDYIKRQQEINETLRYKS